MMANSDEGTPTMVKDLLKSPDPTVRRLAMQMSQMAGNTDLMMKFRY